MRMSVAAPSLESSASSGRRVITTATPAEEGEDVFVSPTGTVRKLKAMVAEASTDKKRIIVIRRLSLRESQLLLTI